jgi:hypothetical protein
VCGNSANCAESNDFAAMITNFRTSDLRGYKIIDVVVRFRNKTANPLVLGYVQGSGTAVDEKGNRYSVGGGNGVRGIGQVYGSTFDPKFALPAGGVGDAQFELMWYPGQQIYGFTFQLDLTVDEINSYEGNQHSLGGEFPLHYEGLTNGVSTGTALASGAVPGATPCNNGGATGTATAVAGATGSAGVQNATGQATSTIATATSAVSGLKSLFGHKKAQQPAATQGGDPCGSATPASSAQAAPSGTGATAVQSVPTTSPGPVAATATATGAIASKNPTTTSAHPVPASVGGKPVTTTATRIPAATTPAKTQAVVSPTTVKTQAAGTPSATTAKVAPTVKATPATPAKKTAATTTPTTPAKP